MLARMAKLPEHCTSSNRMLTGLDDPDAPQAAIEAHAMNPVSVLRLARAMNIEVKNVLLVGCEPETLGGEDGQMGLSASVEAAVDEAVKLVESLIDKVSEEKFEQERSGFNRVNTLRSKRRPPWQWKKMVTEPVTRTRSTC